MDFLGVGPMELIFIFIIALVVIGPRDIGKAARSMGRFLNRLYKSDTWRMLLDTSRTLRNLPERLAREAALEELQQAREAAIQELEAVRQSTGKIGKEISKEVEVLDQEIREAGIVAEGYTDEPDEPEKSSDTQPDQETA
ncbi:MAG: twin-arginine translocase TatA/TatE family subunit [Anaerolineaceae bacterium]|nr:MAG: twin-arginine translocase TatA/TatE family subunit [Anaerolineaceae bacterium]